jgi:hypothetical protein
MIVLDAIVSNIIEFLLIIEIDSFFIWILAKINAILMKFAIGAKVNTMKKNLYLRYQKMQKKSNRNKS